VRAVSAPSWRLYREYLRLVRTENLALAKRRRCCAVRARWWGVNRNSLRVVADLVAIMMPGAVGFAEGLKTRWFGAAPATFRTTSRPMSLERRSDAYLPRLEPCRSRQVALRP
jgi:hypothetical protein